MNRLWRLVNAQSGQRSFKFLPELVAIAAIVIARFSGTLQFLEWTALDAGLRFRPPEPLDERLVVIGIREEDIQAARQYPLSDRTLAELINTLQTYQPAAIGLDIFRDLPVEPGHAELLKTFQSSQNLIAVEKVLSVDGFSVKAPPGIAPEQVGFADALPDADGKLRRSLLGTLSEQGDYRLSLSIRLAEVYLKTKGLTLENGIRDPDAMRFGALELPRIQPNSGGYVRTDAGGNQMLINFRSGAQPFRVLSLQEVQAGVNPDWLRGKVVLIGYTTISVKDVVNTGAVATEKSSLIYGVEMQAHVISQIISGVLDGRPLLTVWTDGWEYLWIVGWGIIGIVVGRLIRSPLHGFGGFLIACASLLGSSYVLLLLGWWAPAIPAFLALLITSGAGIVSFYRYSESLRSRLHDRQIIIDQTFDAIHNGPLQTLAKLLRQVQENPSWQPLAPDLQELNQELREVYDVVRREALLQANTLFLEQEQALDLKAPLHQTLHDVYRTVLERDFPGFKTLKLKVVKFEPVAEHHLSAEQKRGLCRFLEEALCNVGKHAINATRLEVTCGRSPAGNLIRVEDNGKTSEALNDSERTMPHGFGTQQAKNLAKQLSGQFQRVAKEPNGTLCELTWSDRKPWYHFLHQS